MAQSPSEITSPSPFSPFSAYSRSTSSELATSDDAPDLGAFANVFAEFNELREPPTLNVPRAGLDGTPSSSILVLPSDNESLSSPSHPIHAFSPPWWSGPNGYATPSSRSLIQPARPNHADTPSSSILASSDVDSSPSRQVWPPRLATSSLLHTTLREDTSPQGPIAPRRVETIGSLSSAIFTFPSDGDSSSPPPRFRANGRTVPPSRSATLVFRNGGEGHAATSVARDTPSPSRVPPLQRHFSPTRQPPTFPHNEDDFELDDDTDVDIEVEIEGASTRGSPGVVFEMDDDEEADDLAKATGSIFLPDGDAPSLGDLDAALSYLAAERERAAAQVTSGAKATKGILPWLNEPEPKRKRRRKRGRPLVVSADADAPTEPNLADDSSSSVDFSSSLDVSSPVALLSTKSTPATPPRNRRERRRILQMQQEQIELQRSQHPHQAPRLAHAKSSPNLRLKLKIPVDSRVLHMRTLATKLRLLFSEDADYLSNILSRDAVDADDLVDPRGPMPTPEDTLIHVFIDHSNILIGLLNYVRRRMSSSAPKKKHISHSALTLVLERGRPITRRVLAASSPLYQPMDSAEKLGYEVRVYARVPDTGDGADRRPRTSHVHKGSFSGGASTSNESDAALHSPAAAIISPVSPVRPRKQRHAKSYSGTISQSLPAVSALAGLHTSGTPATTVVASPSGRIKYREQGVDELLQLKIHQAIAAVDEPPPGATIVLATGDGNVGQFNEEGFLGCVRTALKKGWRVELYAWEEGLSRSWRREFSEVYRASGQFRIVGLEKFAGDLLDMHVHESA